MTWETAFILTQVAEISVALLLYQSKIFKSYEKNPLHRGKLIGLVFCASTITHPILWFVLYPWSLELELPYNSFLLIGEGYVWLVEGLLYKVGKLPFPFLLSLMLNASSYILGNHLLPLFF